MVNTANFGFGTQRLVLDEQRAYPGLARDRVRCRTCANAQATKQSVSIAAGTPANSTAYTITVGDRSVTYTSDGDATAAEIAAGLDAALKADNLIYADFTVTSNATTVTLTARQFGVDQVVSVSGGGTGYAATNTASTSTGTLAFGTLVVSGSSGAIGGVLPCVLPSTTGQRIIGAVESTHAVARDSEAGTFFAYNSGDEVNVVAQGTIWVLSEVALAAESPIYVRHTANGALTNRGYIAGGSGTGLDLVAGAIAETASITLNDGTILTEVSLNLP